MNPTPNDTITAYIRTYVPYGIGAALAWLLATIGLDLTGDFQIALIALAVVLVTNAYYLAVRLLERVLPILGVLLGIPKTPEYGEVSNLWASFVRTAIPTLVGALVTTVLGIIFHLDAQTQSVFIVLGIAVIEAAYYGLARNLVARYPGLVFLLGSDVTPVYEPRHG
ncbi:hypothetical protein [Herbiconiux sp. VKM Ac-2851]|uniref:hypothetical protein n=1 Tax=Herbiconiux sp. VKM Ac-2851 TaxID=2739025 RepID=UPI001C201DA6|nr:hypothetical protein [Herbiconiux sp. VKM Ac-2851]NQX36240.1 hypothetical protein [Herbiconiux sp. VKM Ac-2851]